MSSLQIVAQQSSNLIPLWLKEIVGKRKNGHISAAFYYISLFEFFDSDSLYASCIVEKPTTEQHNSPTVKQHYSLPSSRPSSHHQTHNIAFFRDGPFLEGHSGGTTGAISSMLGMMEALADNDYNIFLFYCFRGWSDPKLYLGRKFSTIFIRPEDFYCNKRLIEALVVHYGISICQFDSAEAVNWQAPLVQNYSKVVFEVHNVESTLMSQQCSSGGILAYVKEQETNAIFKADIVLLRSRKDMLEMQKLAFKHQHMKMYRGCISFDNVRATKHASTGNLLFMGHLNYAPNIQALHSIATKIAPYIQNTCYIAGFGSDLLQEKYSSENIRFLNWVDDLNDLFCKVDIALAPITSGSGTSLKVLEYMAHHVPVIATSTAIRGLKEGIIEAVILEDDIDNYPTVVQNLLKQPELMRKYAKLGCSYVRQNYDWKIGIGEVIQAYLALQTYHFQANVSFEGMPRAGKSTTFNRLKTEFSDFVDFSEEIFFNPAYLDQMGSKEGTVIDSIWLLDRETDRKHAIDTSTTKKPVFLADRSYLTTLAYSYARALLSNCPEDFAQVEKYYLLNQEKFPSYDIIFIFDADPSTTIARRKLRKSATNLLWKKETFMELFREFYQKEINHYTSAKLIWLDADSTLEGYFQDLRHAFNILLRPFPASDNQELADKIKKLELQILSKDNLFFCLPRKCEACQTNFTYYDKH